MRLARSPPHHLSVGGGTLNSLFYCPSRVIHHVELLSKKVREKKTPRSPSSAKQRKKRKKKKKKSGRIDNAWCTITVVIKCRCIWAIVLREGVLWCDCLWKTLKPNRASPSKGNPEDMAKGGRWVMRREVGSAYKLPHLFWLRENSPLIYPLGRDAW